MFQTSLAEQTKHCQEQYQSTVVVVVIIIT